MSHSENVIIERRSNLSQKELLKEYIEVERPVILTNTAKGWKGFGVITPEFFKNNYPGISKQVGDKVYTMSDFVDIMISKDPGTITPYPFNFNIEKYFPELLELLRPEILYAKSDRVNHKLMPKFLLSNTQAYEFFLGGRGSRWPTLHFDILYMHTQITQLYGSKTFFMYPPEQSAYLYPNPQFPKNSMVDIFNPDYEKFPLFKKASCIKVTIDEGETILFPKGWWHTTEMHGPSISLGRVQLNSSNWKDFCNDNYNIWKQKNVKFRQLAYLYGRSLGVVLDLQEKLFTKN